MSRRVQGFVGCWNGVSFPFMANTRTSRARDEAARAIEAVDRRGRSGEETRSPVAWLVLGLLIERPSHGYELSQRYEERFASFAAMSVPRVYAALDRLRDNGMIEAVALDTAGPVPKQHLMRRSYRVTPPGVNAYRAWVAERMREDPQRPQLLARIASAGSLGLDGVLDVIDRYERACLEELQALPTDTRELEDGDFDAEQLARFLISDQQRRELNARREWAVHARGLVQAQIRRRGADEAAGGGS
jgi:DNA-binding PadR family transcriptional regulator